MTSVPKPLKFLRDHYNTIKEVYSKINEKETKVIEELELVIFIFLKRLFNLK
jgi:hypothetical protein